MYQWLGIAFALNAVNEENKLQKKKRRHIGKMGYAVLVLTVLNIVLFAAMWYQVYR